MWFLLFIDYWFRFDLNRYQIKKQSWDTLFVDELHDIGPFDCIIILAIFSIYVQIVRGDSVWVVKKISVLFLAFFIM